MLQPLKNLIPERTAPFQLALTLLTSTMANSLALSQPVRAWYADGDKLAHAVACAHVYAGQGWALRGWAWWETVLLELGLGAMVEVHQVFQPGFMASVGKWGADALSAAIAAGAYWA